MAELEPQPAAPSPAGAAAVPAGDVDPIARLHKMSTTAGVGSGDYVAINTMAVVAVLVALASALVFFTRSGATLLIPAAAIVLAVMAWVQVSRSNGTQAGRGLAALAILIAAGVAATKVTLNWRSLVANAPDEKRVNTLIADLGKAIAADQYDKAYTHFTPEFQREHGLQEFSEKLKLFHQSSMGRVLSIEGNGVVRFDDETGMRIGDTLTVFRFEKDDPKEDNSGRARPSVRVRESSPGSGRFLVSDWDLFPPKQAPRPRRGAAGPGGGQ